jgi:hypothetical protein
MVGLMDAMTRYRIVVRGRLSDRLAASLDGFELEPAAGVTVMRGALADQAQLQRIPDLGIELVSLNADD